MARGGRRKASDVFAFREGEKRDARLTRGCLIRLGDGGTFKRGNFGEWAVMRGCTELTMEKGKSWTSRANIFQCWGEGLV